MLFRLMRARSFALAASFAAASLALAMSPAPAAPSEQQVDIRHQGGLLHAVVAKPDGAGPFPVVIAAHDCGGLQGRAAQVRSRYRDWTDYLVKAGYAVVLPDSYGSRDLGPQCRMKASPVRASHERVADLQASRQWAAEQPWVQASRISLIGWGEGAEALLWAVRQHRGERGNDLRSAIAFYPDCKPSSALAWSARVPTLVLMGADDDVNSPSACRQMVDDAKGRSAFARFVAYPRAMHAFDQANIAVQSVDGRSDADLPERGHIGTNVKARSDALKRVVKWLAR